MPDNGTWNVYLAGEIHSDWREQIAEGVSEAGLPVSSPRPSPTTAPPTTSASTILGDEDDKFWHDHKGAGVNAIRTQTLIRRADVVVVRFGEKYKQWNAAFDAGYRGRARQADRHPAPAGPRPRAEGDRPRRDGHRGVARAGRRDPPLRDGQGVGEKQRQ